VKGSNREPGIRISTRDRLLETTALAVISLVCVVVLLVGSSCSHPRRSSTGTHSVHAAQVSELTVPVELTTTGEVIPSLVHSITAPFTGEVTAVYCREGQDVGKGQLLFTIDALPHEKLLRQKQAALEGGRTRLVPYTVHSPMDGRATNLHVQAGGVVQMKNQTPLIMIQRLVPVFVRFQIPKQYFGRMMTDSRAGKLKVQTFTDPDRAHRSAGTLSFVDSSTDETQKEIGVRAIFPNLDKALHPGKPVNVVLTLTPQPRTILIPAASLKPQGDAQSVFVIRPDHTLELRPVVVSRRMEYEVVIERGLKVGEWIVAEQQPNLYPGERVVPHPQASMVDAAPRAQE
jgi:membrane fusion protein, multidrug efflux system